mmetsp:Transcript_113292/g.360100  ORF Transcript_113292/g.360100 Transcript_113292/m.360100 type:complete len:241 (-) Transcript_113292:334-1056(-)
MQTLAAASARREAQALLHAARHCQEDDATLCKVPANLRNVILEQRVRMHCYHTHARDSRGGRWQPLDPLLDGASMCCERPLFIGRQQFWGHCIVSGVALMQRRVNRVHRLRKEGRKQRRRSGGPPVGDAHDFHRTCGMAGHLALLHEAHCSPVRGHALGNLLHIGVHLLAHANELRPLPKPLEVIIHDVLHHRLHHPLPDGRCTTAPATDRGPARPVADRRRGHGGCYAFFTPAKRRPTP